MFELILSADEGYQPLLSLPSFDPSTSTATDDRPEANGAETSIRSIEASIIPDSSKIAILLEAAEEFRSGERDLREIELLKRRGVEGSGELESASGIVAEDEHDNAVLRAAKADP